MGARSWFGHARKWLLSAGAGGVLVAGVLVGAPGASAASASLPCDIYAAAGTACVAAHSSTRALFAAYNGPLYQVTRVSDGATHDIGLLSTGGYANAADQDAFCNGTTCRITKVYDQTTRHNDLTPGPAGTAGTGADRGADAGEIAVTAGGHKVYGIWISPQVGYRYTGVASGVAVNGQPEGVYMVASGTHVGSACCFDYGNAESTPADTGNGHMDAVSIATTCFPQGTITGPGGQCVDVAADDTGVNLAAVQLWGCQSYAEDQHWTHNANGSLSTLGRCLDIDGNGTAGGTLVELYDCNGVGGQVWQQQSDGSLLNPQSGLCLDDPNGVTTNGTQLRIWTCNGAAAQKFALS